MQISGAAMRTIGMDEQVPVLGSGTRRYVNLDNSASTPPLVQVQDALHRFMPHYSSVHRGAGFKSRVATQALDRAREITLKFVGANSATHTAIFGTNTTEALNRLAQLYPFAPGDVIISTGMEHHSNDLPWRARTHVEYVAVTLDGRLDLPDLSDKLQANQGRVRLVSVTGASNVTGFINPIHEIARLVHRHGAHIVVDAAQLAPHRSIAMHQPDPAACIDFLVLSGHKMYAPFGAGALVAPIAFLQQVDPDRQGGGAVRIVSQSEVYLAGVPDRFEPGSPNTVGIVAMGAAMRVLMDYGMDQVAEHELQLTRYALEQMHTVPGIQLFGSSDPAEVDQRVGVIPFNIEGTPHGLVAAILAQEGGIGVRSGCFCAHPYVVKLLGVGADEFDRFRDETLAGSKAATPGMVRASFGCYSKEEDVDALVRMLRKIARGEYRRGYRLNSETGEYSHPDYEACLTSFAPVLS